MAHPLITVADVELRMKTTFAAGADTDQIEAFISDASALVRDIAERSFHDADTDAEETLPAAIKPVIVAMVRRAIEVPTGAAAGLSGENFPAYSWSGGGGLEGGQPAASIYATRRERGIIRRAAGASPVAAVPITGEMGYVEDPEEEVVI